MAQTMKDILNRMLNHEELSREEMKNILIGITHSDYPTEQITALLTALQMRGVTVDELLGFRDGILETGVPALLKADRYIDVVGTGGDRKNTFNISTTACFVIAGAGYKVASRYRLSARPTLRKGYEVCRPNPQGPSVPDHLQPLRSAGESQSAPMPVAWSSQPRSDALI